MKNDLRIVIIDDDQIWRSGCELLLSEIDGFTVVGSYAVSHLNLENLSGQQPELILFGVNQPNFKHVKILSEIKSVILQTPILILAVVSRSEIIFETFKLGVSGYVAKDLSMDHLLDSIKAVMSGGAIFSADVAKKVINFFQINSNSPLTKRETDILQLIAEGKTKIQIATELFIKQNTVRTHVKSIYVKLNVTSRSEAIKAAKEKRFI
jgi:DNA-binding NarL/FixJ family response regulator